MLKKLSLKWIAVFSIATNCLIIVPSLHMLQVYDRVLASNSLETLLYITLITVAAMVLYGVSESVRGKLAQRAAARYTVMVSDPLFSRLSKNPNAGQESNGLLRDFNAVRTFIASRTLIGLFDLPFAPLFVVLMFLLHWSLGLLTLVGLGLLVGVAFLNKKMTADASSRSKQADNEALGFAQAVFARSEDIRAMGLMPAIMQRWGERMGIALQSGDEATGKSSAYYGLSKSVRKILQVVIMAWGAYLVIGGEISGGVIFAASMISSRALAPVEQVIGGWDRIVQSRHAFERIEDCLSKTADEHTPVRLPEPRGELSVSQLTYAPSAYPGAKPILDDVSFSIEAGKVLAVVGPSGAGKSTLAKMLVGSIVPDSGVLMLDGAHRTQWPDDQWGETVGYVSQEIVLFPGTLAENIARLETNPNEQMVVEAAQAAGVHEMITSLPEGYATEIGPGKVPLSGGQKQRVALARALYSNPRVLVLDEPNAHLDAQGEGSLMEALARARSVGRTIVIVTQRRSVLQIADNVLTVRDGRVESLVNVAAQRAKASAERGRVAAPAMTTPEVAPDRPPQPSEPVKEVSA